MGAKHAVAFSSGTAALHGASFAANVKKGDEIITTPLTFAASANCILYQNATPIFADIDPETMNISAQEIERCITPKTRGILTVDFTGEPCDQDKIHRIAKKHNLITIDDASHALGARYKDRMIGSISDMTTFSFHPVKHITTGEGGMVTTNDAELAHKLEVFRNHGIANDHLKRSSQGTWFYEMTHLGFNYRISDFQCSLGMSQLKKLPFRLKRRRDIANKYSRAFKKVDSISTPISINDRASAWHIYVIKLNLDLLNVDRKRIFEALRAENIGVNVHYIPIPMHPYYQNLGYNMDHLNHAKETYERILTLPIWAGMNDQDVKDTIDAVTKVVNFYRK